MGMFIDISLKFIGISYWHFIRGMGISYGFHSEVWVFHMGILFQGMGISYGHFIPRYGHFIWAFHFEVWAFHMDILFQGMNISYGHFIPRYGHFKMAISFRANILYTLSRTSQDTILFILNWRLMSVINFINYVEHYRYMVLAKQIYSDINFTKNAYNYIVNLLNLDDI